MVAAVVVASGKSSGALRKALSTFIVSVSSNPGNGACAL
jgi:hypothetical protein